jgi:hypothetical protein
MHGPPRARHRDIKLCLVRLAKRANRHADNDLVHTLGLAGVTGDRYSLVEMKSGAIANDLALSNMILPSSMSITVRSSLLRNLCPRPLTFFVNRIGSLIDSDLLLLEHAELPCLVKWHLLLDALFPTMTAPSSRRRTSHRSPLLKALFLDSSTNRSIPRQSYETRRFALAYK